MNEPTAQPTPYDITEIPVFPYEPGALFWSLPAGLAMLLVAALVVRRFLRARNPNPGSRALRIFREELRILARAGDREHAARAALLTRRFLSSATERDFAAMTPDELKDQLEAPDGGRYAPLLLALIPIESARFSPEEQSFAGMLNDLCRAAEQLREEAKP